MIILLYGPDSYRRQKELNKIIQNFRDKHATAAFERFNFEEGNEKEEFLRFQEFALSQSIFSAKKLAMLENAWNPEIKEIKKFLKGQITSEDLTLVISEEKSPPAIFKFLFDEAHTVSEFDNLTGEKLKIFIKKEAEERGINLSQRALIFLAQEFDSDTWALITEIEKLSLTVKSGEKAVVDLPKILEIGDYKQALDFFSFINIVERYGRMPEKIEALEELFFAREEPAKIFNILASRNYLSPEMVRKLADYDVAVKSGRMDYDEVLLELALS